jgi:hypothetical protein
MIEIENLKVGLLWYDKGSLNVSKAIKAFERRFEHKPDTIYYNIENNDSDFGNLKAVESDVRIKDQYLLTRGKSGN